MARLEDRFRSSLRLWMDRREGAARLDTDWQRDVDAAAGFTVTDLTVHRLPASPSGRVIVPAIGCHERAEQEVLRILAARAPETIPAFFAFYLEMYARQVTPPPQRRWLASRSRDRLFWLARQQKQLTPGGREERQRRGMMLMMLADAMQSAPYFTEILEARGLLEEVIDLSPESVAARYMAATLAERTGDYEVAVRALERLVRQRPEDEEVALRLAINRLRTGDERAARRGLESLARGDGPSWVRVLAYQEWVAQGSGARGQGSRERELLAEAMSEFPGDQQLALQLAAALIRAGEWGAAERVAAASSPGDPDEPTPRSFYDMPRRDEMNAVTGHFRAAVEVGTARLRQLMAANSDGD